MTPAIRKPANDNNPRPATFDAAVLQWLPFLHRMAREFAPAAPEDLVQETIATALHRWAGYNPETSFPAWLVFQMRERCRDMRRKGRPLLTVLPESTPAAQEDYVIARQALESVPVRYSKTIAMAAAGFNQHEIAAVEGVSHQAIQQRVAKVRRGLAA